MTTPAAAVPWGVGVPGAGTRSATVLPPTPSRQLRARNAMLLVAAGFAAVALLGTAQQVAARGWHAFVFRPPGVGGSPPLPEHTTESATPTQQPAAVPTTPPVKRWHHIAVRWPHRHPHHLTRRFATPAPTVVAPVARPTTAADVDNAPTSTPPTSDQAEPTPTVTATSIEPPQATTALPPPSAERQPPPPPDGRRPPPPQRQQPPPPRRRPPPMPEPER